MPTVQSELVAKGIEFTNGYVSNPRVLPQPVEHPHRSVLAPDRCVHEPPEGAVRRVPRVPRPDRPWRHGSTTTGYRTALMGKYLNGYAESYVPPGWDRWFVTWDGGALLRLLGERRTGRDELRLRRPRTTAPTCWPIRPRTSSDRPTTTSRCSCTSRRTRRTARRPRPRVTRRRSPASSPWRPAELRRGRRVATSRRTSGPRSRCRRRRERRSTGSAATSTGRSLAVDRAVSDDPRRADRHRAVVEHDDRVHVGQRHAVGRAPVASKVVPYEESIRVPFVIRARRVDRLARAATITSC